MSAPRRPARARDSASATSLDETLVVEAAAGTGKTTELVARIVAVLARGAARCDGDRRGDLHREGGGRAEAAAARRARGGAAVGAAGPARRREPRRRARPARGGAHQHHPRLLRRPAARAAGGGAGRSALRGADGARGRGALRRGLRPLVRGACSRIRPRACAARSAAAPTLDEGDPVERLRRAGWTLAGWRDFRAPWRREPFDRERAIDALVERVHAFRDSSARCAQARATPLYARHVAGRGASARTSGVQRALARPATTTGSRRRCATSPRSRQFRRPRKGYDRNYRGGVTREEVARGARRAPRRARATSRGEPTPTSPRCSTQELSRPSTLRGAQARARGASTSSTCCLRRATSSATAPTCARELQERFTPHLRRRVPGHRSAAGRDPAAARGGRPRGAELARGDAGAGQAVRGRRSQAVDLPLPPRRRRALPGGARSSCATRGAACRRAVVRASAPCRRSSGGQRRVRAAMRTTAPTLQAGYVPLAPAPRASAPASRAWSRCRCREPYGRLGPRQDGDRGVAARRGRRLRALARQGERLDGDRARAARRVTCRSRRATCASCSGASPAGATTSPGRTSRRSRRAASRTCSSAGSRSTCARRSRACAPRSPRSSGPTTSSRSSRTLRGPLFALGDEALLEYRQRGGRLHPFAVRAATDGAPLPAHLAPIVDALGCSPSCTARRNRRPIEDTVSRAARRDARPRRRRAPAAGEQALANVLRIAELARRFEAAGGISFRGFVERLDEEREGEAPEAPVVEEGTEGVRIMTVHRAKGLEFPVVVLADITANATAQNPSRYIDSERGLCAVRAGRAGRRRTCSTTRRTSSRATAPRACASPTWPPRARATCWSCPPSATTRSPARWEAAPDGWIAPVQQAVFPPAESRRAARPAPGAPPFGEDSVLERPEGDARRPRQRRARAPRAGREAASRLPGGVVGSARADPRRRARVRHPPPGADRGPGRRGPRGRPPARIGTGRRRGRPRRSRERARASPSRP